MEFRVSCAKICDLRREIHSTLSLYEGRQLTLRLFSPLIGKFTAVRGAMTAAPMHILPLFHLVLRRQAKWDDRMSLSTRVIEELQWWADELQAWNGKSIIPARH